MGKVISFEKAKKKNKKFNPNKKKAKIATRKTTCESSRTDVDYANMESEEQIEHWKNIEKEEEERFREKYKDVLSAVPTSAGEKMQYFAKVMLHLLSDIFHNSNWDIRFDAWLNFCEFYISYFDSAYSDYAKENKGFEKEYQYKFKEMTAEELEEELVDCLGKIIALHPEKTDANKTAMMYQASRLFELQDSLTDLFIMEVTND